MHSNNNELAYLAESKFYVHGCTECDGSVGYAEDEDAQFWTVYERDANGLSQAIVDCSDKESAMRALAAFKERDQLAAECGALNEQMQKLIQIINNADNSYCMCGEAMKAHGHGGCGHPTGMFDYHYNQWLESSKETPATDRFLAEQRSSGVSDFCNLLASYAKVEPEQFDPHFADLYAKIANRIFSEAMDNPEVYDLETLSDWLERESINSRAYADISIKHHEYNAQEPAQ